MQNTESALLVSPTSSYSSKKTCHFSPTVPAINIAPSTPSHLPTNPLTPLTPCLKRNTSYFHSELTASPPRAPACPISPLLAVAYCPRSPLPDDAAIRMPIGIPSPTPHDVEHHLHEPLCAHLMLLHPSTPREIVHFCATRLLSPDRPFALPHPDGGATGRGGSEGEPIGSPMKGDKVVRDITECEVQWTPIWTGLRDLATTGLGKEAAKGCQQVGPGREIDEKLEWMYAMARQSWGLLEKLGPSQGNRL